MYLIMFILSYNVANWGLRKVDAMQYNGWWILYELKLTDDGIK